MTTLQLTQDYASPSRGCQVQDLQSLLLLLGQLLSCMGTEGFRVLFLLATLQENNGSEDVTLVLCVCLFFFNKSLCSSHLRVEL